MDSAHDNHLSQNSCPSCGSDRVDTRHEERSFMYGEKTDAVQIFATLPVRVCQSCNFEWLDEEGELAEHNAVCKQLKVMTPDEIAALRTKYGVTRAEFARITRIGEATLSRWERGALIQNPAMDQLLTLLRNPDNFHTLKSRLKPMTSKHDANKFHFRALAVTDQLVTQASRFQL